MNIGYYNENTKKYDNCRIKSIRDLILLYGYDVPYELLFLLSMKNNINAGTIEYKGLKFPVISPIYYNCDLEILKNTEINYKVVKAEQEDKEWVGKKIHNDMPVLCYYSKNTLLTGSRNNAKIELVNSMVIYDIHHDNYYCNVEEKKILKWDEIWKSRISEVKPISSETKIIWIEDEHRLVEKLDEKLLFIKVHEILDLFCYNYLNKKMDNTEQLEFYQGSQGVEEMIKLIDNLRQSFYGVKEMHLVKRYFLLAINIMFRFMRINTSKDSFERDRFIAAIRYLAVKTRNKDLEKWCSKNKGLCKEWMKVSTLLFKYINYTQSRETIDRYFEKLGLILGHAGKREKESISELYSIIKINLKVN